MSSLQVQLPQAFLESPLKTTLFGLVGVVVLCGIVQAFQPSEIRFYYRKSPYSSGQEGIKSNFAETCKSVTPPCRLNPFLFNGHLQTLWNNFFRHSVSIHYKRRYYEQQDPRYPGSFAIDFVSRPETTNESGSKAKTVLFPDEEFRKINSDDSKPMLVVLHSLGGGSHERYLREAIAPLVSEKGGWEACVVISRGCSGTQLSSNLLYNARATWDLKQSVVWLRKTFPNRPLYGLGFSIGANILTNYVGEEGAECVLKAAVAISNPWNLEVGSVAMQRTWIGRNVYLRSLGSMLKTLFKKHSKVTNMHPGIDIQAVQRIRYMHDFDRVVQLPMWDYPTVGAYYRDASSVDALLAVEIPFFAINALDDPVVVAETIPKEEFQVSTQAVLCTTTHGGHLGWFEFGGQRWMTKVVTSLFQKIADEMDPQHPFRLQPSSNSNGSLPERQILKNFDPMRRKML